MNRKDYEYQSYLARQLVDLRQRNLAGKMSDEEFKARWDRIAPEYETLCLRGITEGYGFLVATIIQSVLEQPAAGEEKIMDTVSYKTPRHPYHDGQGNHICSRCGGYEFSEQHEKPEQLDLAKTQPAPRTITAEQLYEDFKQCLVHPDWQNRKISELRIVDFNNLTLRINAWVAGQEK